MSDLELAHMSEAQGLDIFTGHNQPLCQILACLPI